MRHAHVIAATLLVLLCSLGGAFIPARCTDPVFSSQTGKVALGRVAFSLQLFRPRSTPIFAKMPGNDKLSKKRREQLGIADDEDEYDLGFALDQNTDPLITKLIAGSLILVLIALLVVGVVVPSLTDYGEGVCSPIQTGGRC